MNAEEVQKIVDDAEEKIYQSSKIVHFLISKNKDYNYTVLCGKKVSEQGLTRGATSVTCPDCFQQLIDITEKTYEEQVAYVKKTSLYLAQGKYMLSKSFLRMQQLRMMKIRGGLKEPSTYDIADPGTVAANLKRENDLLEISMAQEKALDDVTPLKSELANMGDNTLLTFDTPGESNVRK